MSIYTNVRRTFVKLASDSTWLYTGENSDTSYLSFYNKCLNLTIGRVEKIWQQLNSTAVDSLALDSLYAEEKKDDESSYSVIVLPNPTRAFIAVKILGAEYPVQVRIIDFSGRVVQQNIQAVTEQQYTLDNLASGAYLYQLRNPAGLLQRGRLVVTRH